MTKTLSTVVDADYGQFYVNNIGSLPAGSTDTYLAYNFEGFGNLMMIAARQYGQLPVAVTLHEARPEPLGGDWLDVVEVSIEGSDQVYVSSWGAPLDDGLRLELLTTAYRLRYAIDNMDIADVDDDDVAEKYRIDLWPEAASPAVVVRSESQLGGQFRKPV